MREGGGVGIWGLGSKGLLSEGLRIKNSRERFFPKLPELVLVWV